MDAMCLLSTLSGTRSLGLFCKNAANADVAVFFAGGKGKTTWILLRGLYFHRVLQVRLPKTHKEEPLESTGTGFFTGRMPFLLSNQQCQNTQGVRKRESQTGASTPIKHWGGPSPPLPSLPVPSPPPPFPFP